MPSFALTKFQQLAATTSGTRAVSLILANPVLLARSMWPEFEHWVQQCQPDVKPGADRALYALTAFADKMAQQIFTYPVGSGPLESIVHRLRVGEITESYAREVASSSELY
jgi:hypothetical protein